MTVRPDRSGDLVAAAGMIKPVIDGVVGPFAVSSRGPLLRAVAIQLDCFVARIRGLLAMTN
jgi:hypothetical protein